MKFYIILVQKMKTLLYKGALDGVGFQSPKRKKVFMIGCSKHFIQN
jgi:hypothetical protein